MILFDVFCRGFFNYTEAFFKGSVLAEVWMFSLFACAMSACVFSFSFLLRAAAPLTSYFAIGSVCLNSQAHLEFGENNTSILLLPSKHVFLCSCVPLYYLFYVLPHFTRKTVDQGSRNAQHDIENSTITTTKISYF